MIRMSKIRLINWHKAGDETAPIGNITLFVGRNASGKSTVLDAILYALYSDTNFNSAKGGKSKGKRTLKSYTRGYINNDTGECLRPVKTSPEVYTHIILEFCNDKTGLHFILGTVIKTDNEDSQPVPARYVIKGMTIDEMECTYMKDGKGPLPYTDKMIEEKYGVKLIRDVSAGIEMFSQAMGCNYTAEQIKDIRKTQNKIISYDKQADIGSFIRDNVLEAKNNSGFRELAENKKNIEELTEQLKEIDKEYNQIKKILDTYDDIENLRNTSFACEASLNCITLKETDDEITEASKRQRGIRSEISDKESALAGKEDEIKDISDRIDDAEKNLKKNDYEAQLVNIEKAIDNNENLIERTEKSCDALSELQKVIDTIIIYAAPSNRDILAGLTKNTHTFAEKEAAIIGMRQKLDEIRQSKWDELRELQAERRQMENIQKEQSDIINECKRYKNNYKSIQDYSDMCAAINEEFRRRGIKSKARLACDDVISISNEEWRDTIEGILGRGRYIILTDPEYYDIAYDIFRNKKSKAHILNTKLLLRNHSNTKCEEDSLANMLEINDRIARLYFDYRLGYIHAVDAADVIRYENAASKDGMLSMHMDCQHLDFTRINSYFLGAEAFELNRKKAEAKYKEAQEKIDALSEKGENLSAEIEEIKSQDEVLSRNYEYDCFAEAQRLKKEATALNKQKADLLKAKANDHEYIAMAEQYAALKQNKKKLDSERDEIKEAIADLNRNLDILRTQAEKLQSEEEQAEEDSTVLMRKDSVLYKKMKEMVENEELGGSSKKKLRDASKEADINAKYKQFELNTLKDNYNMRYKPVEKTEPGETVTEDTNQEETRKKYLARARNIDIRHKADINARLKEQEEYYKVTFKNRAILEILNECRKARGETIHNLNVKLRDINFGTNTYQFVCKDIEEGTEYGKILSYAKYLADENVGVDMGDGQLTLESLMPDNEIHREKEAEIDRLVDEIINAGPEKIAAFSDYRNYMTYDIDEEKEENGQTLHLKLSKQDSSNSGAETQIPYLLTLISSLLVSYGKQTADKARLLFLDEPFATMDPDNAREMIKFLQNNGLQVVFFAPGKIETIGSYCDTKNGVMSVNSRKMALSYIRNDELLDIDDYVEEE